MKRFKRYGEQVNVRIPHSMKKELQAQAKREGISLSKLVKTKILK